MGALSLKVVLQLTRGFPTLIEPILDLTEEVGREASVDLDDERFLPTGERLRKTLVN